jgi:membrane protease YdiL (CAAX protease family)
MTPTADYETPREEAFWTYEDLALFIGAVLPALAGALLVVRPFHLLNKGVQQFAYQCTAYALMLGALYLLVAWRYHRPFWRSLGWNFEFRGAWFYLILGPVMAIGLTMLAYFLHAAGNPAIPDLITDRASMIAVALFGALAGPIFEELVFRGFLQPLLARSMAAWIAILLTAVPFALLHGPGFGWAWQSVIIVGIAGVVMGYVRNRTGSTAASALVHIGYNSTLFVGFILQRFLQPLGSVAPR